MAQGKTAIDDILGGGGSVTALDDILGPQEEGPGFVETVRHPSAMAARGLASTAGGAVAGALAPPQGVVEGVQGLIQRGINAVMPSPFARGSGLAEGITERILPASLQAAANVRERFVPESVNRAQSDLMGRIPGAARSLAQAVNPPSEKVSRMLGRMGPKIPGVGRTPGQIIGEDVPEAIGSSIPFLAGGGVPGAAAVGALSQAGNDFARVKEQTGDERKAWTAYVAGLPSGATEALDASIAGGQLSRISRKLGGGFLASLLVNGAAEGLQEGSQGVLQEYVDSKLTGSEKDFLQTFAHSFLVGSITGGILGGPGSIEDHAGGQAEAEGVSRRERVGARTEPVEREPMEGLSPEATTELETFAEQARKAKPQEDEEGNVPRGMPLPLSASEGLRAVKPTTPAEKFAAELFGKAGKEMLLVERSGGGRLGLAGKVSGDGKRILLDAHAPAEAMFEAAAFHELLAHLGEGKALYEAWKANDPEGMALATEQSRADHAKAGVPFEEGTDLAEEEAVGWYAEQAVGYLKSRFQSPEALARAFEANPGLARKILDFLRDLMSKIPGLRIQSSEAQRWNKAKREFALTGFEKGKDAAVMKRAADLAFEAYGKLREAAAKIPEAPAQVEQVKAEVRSEPEKPGGGLAEVAPEPQAQPIEAPGRAGTAVLSPSAETSARPVESRKPKMADKIRERAITRGGLQEWVRAKGGIKWDMAEGRELAGTFSTKEHGKNPFGLGPIAHTEGSMRGRPWEQLKEAAFEDKFFPGFESSAEVTYADFYEALSSNRKRTPEIESETEKAQREANERAMQGLSPREFAKRMKEKRLRDEVAARREELKAERARKKGERESRIERNAIAREEELPPNQAVEGVPFAVPREEPFAQMPKGKIIGHDINGDPIYSKLERGDAPRVDAGIKKAKASQIGMFDEQGGLFEKQAEERDAGRGSRFAVARPDSLGFRSALEDAAEEKLSGKMPAAQVLKTLENVAGVKPEEVEWSGLRDFLKGKLIVTKQEVMDYLRMSNVRVEEKGLGSPPTGSVARLRGIDQEMKTVSDERLALQQEKRSGGYEHFDEPPDWIKRMKENTELGDSLLAERKEIEDSIRSSRGKFEQYQTPGGTNYRELRLTLPEARDAETVWEVWRPDRNNTGQSTVWARYTNKAMADQVAARENGVVVQATEERGRPSFTGGHFSDTPNVLAHMRVNDRTTADGKRMLFLEEIQSDWHQKGDKARRSEIKRRLTEKGIKPPAKGEKPSPEYEAVLRSVPEWFGYAKARDVNIPALDARAEETEAAFAALAERARREATSASGMRGLSDTQISSATRLNAWRGDAISEDLKAQLKVAVEEMDAARQAREDARPSAAAVPDAPFKKTWHELALKRAIRYAAENGYDSVGWTTGAMQVDRYNEAMRQNVDKIEVDPRPRIPEMQLAENVTQPGKWDIQRQDRSGNWIVWATYDTESKARADMVRERFSLIGQGEKYMKDSGRIYVRAWKNGAEKFGAEVPLEGSTQIHGHDASLEDVVGKDLASKIRAKPGEKQSFEGEGLMIGGEGMRGFYDVMLPAAANKIGKVGGAKAGMATIEGKATHGKAAGADEALAALRRNDNLGFDTTRQAAEAILAHPDWATRWEIVGELDKQNLAEWRANKLGNTVHSLDITPALRSVAMEKGFARFAVPRAVANGGFDVEEEGRADTIYRVMANDLEPLVRAEKQAPNKLQAPGGETLETALSRMPGRIYAGGEKLNASFVKPLKAKLREFKVTREEADDALLDLSAPKANETLAKRHPRKFGDELNPGSGIRTSEAQARTAKRLAGKDAEFYRWLQDWNRRLNKHRLDTLEDGQLISSEQRAGWVEAWGEDYVPYRTLEDSAGEHFGGGPGLGVSGPESMRREGRTTKADSPLAFSLSTALRAIERVERVRVGSLTADLVRRNPGAFWGVVDDRGKAPDSAKVLSFKEGGEQRWIWTTNEPLGEAFERLAADPGFVKVVDPVLRFLRKTITQWDPSFPLRNMPKDAGVATLRHAIHGDYKAAAATLKGAIPAARGAFQASREEGAGGVWGEWYRKARDAGALIGWNESFNPEERIKELDRAANDETKLRKLGAFMSDLNKATELGTRVAGFRSMVESGMSEAQAAMKTRRITVDFARKGKWAPVYNRLYLFSGANIQGTSEMLGSIAKNPARAATVLGTYAGVGLMNYVLSRIFGDDDEMEKLSEEDKARFFGVMIGKHRVGVMAPYGFNVFPYMGWKLGEVLMGGGDKSEAAGNVAAQAFKALNPVPQGASVTMSLTPTLARPFEEIAENRDFAGRLIAPPENPYARVQTPAHLRKFRGVSAPADTLTTGLSKVGIEVSPEWVEHLGKAATGGAGTFSGRFADSILKTVTGDLGEMRLSDFPIARPFVQQPARGASARIFYENLEKIAQEEQNKKLGEDFDADVLKWAKLSKLIEKQIGKLKEAQDKTKDDEARKKLDERIEFLRGRLNSAMRGKPVEAR